MSRRIEIVVEFGSVCQCVCTCRSRRRGTSFHQMRCHDAAGSLHRSADCTLERSDTGVSTQLRQKRLSTYRIRRSAGNPKPSVPDDTTLGLMPPNEVWHMLGQSGCFRMHCCISYSRDQAADDI